MKASELRQNNWIRNRKLKKDEQVFMLGSWVGSINGKINGEDSHSYIPIPLTEEWLLKFGFEIWDNDRRFKKFSKHGDVSFMSFRISKSGCVVRVAEGVSFKIYHVHQLQNLLFPFGIELTIK